jgi:hypothetical protein
MYINNYIMQSNSVYLKNKYQGQEKGLQLLIDVRPLLTHALSPKN